MIRYFVQMSGINSMSRKVLATHTHTHTHTHTYIYIYIYTHTHTNIYICGPGRSVGIATDYGLDGPGSKPGMARFSALPDRPWGPPSLL